MMKPYSLGGQSGEQQEGQPRTYFKEVSNKVYEHYLDYDLDDFSIARELCTVLRGVDPEDTVALRINSMGGRFDVATQIINAINECPGTVIGIIEQECASAATMVFLACSQWQVNPWGEMMIHYTSYGTGGKGHEISARVTNSDVFFPKVFREIYEHFLSEEEIVDVIKGQDIYLTQDSIISRLELVAEKRNQEQEGGQNEESEVEEADQCVQVPENSKKRWFNKG
jgi:ATP-dependent protease ClpP protease subunit